MSLWLKTVPLKPEYRKKLYTRAVGVLNAGAQSQKQRREKQVALIIKNGQDEINKPLSMQSYRLIGAALYWAEGSKTRLFQLTNSDPVMILFWVKWLNKILNIQAKILKARLNIYPQQNESNIKTFWSDLTGIPLVNFGKSYIKPLSKNYKKNNLYYGTIRIEVPKSTDLRYRVYGWIKAVLADIEPHIIKVERKWARLKTVARPVNMV